MIAMKYMSYGQFLNIVYFYVTAFTVWYNQTPWSNVFSTNKNN